MKNEPENIHPVTLTGLMPCSLVFKFASQLIHRSNHKQALPETSRR